MALFTWSSNYSVKVKRFDEDHQQLFAIINELHDGMKAGRSKDVMHDVLTKLLRYTERHFTAEEAVMKELGYTQLPAHIEQHRKFTGKIKEVADQYKAVPPASRSACWTFLPSGCRSTSWASTSSTASL